MAYPLLQSVQMTKTDRYLSLDILRTILAITVVCFHAFNCYPEVFDKQFSFHNNYFNYHFPGHIRVLIFFCLSGYLISLHTPKLNDKASITSYIKKRLMRILPIYFMAIAFTVLITWGKYNWGTIVANLLFVSVPGDNVFYENGPIWYLNYEMLFYFIYIFFSYYNISLLRTVKILLAAIALLFFFFHHVKIQPLVISYLVGLLFWTTGAAIGEKTNQRHWNISLSRLMAIFILTFCIERFNPYWSLVKLFNINLADYSGYSWNQQSMSYNDLYYYPLTILLILALTKTYSKKYIYLLAFIFISSVIKLASVYKMYGWGFLEKEHYDYVVPVIAFSCSVTLWFADFKIGNFIKSAAKSIAPLSKITYGIYLTHMPLLVLFGMTTSTTSPGYFTLKIIAFVAILLLVSYWLEMKFQPYVRKLSQMKPARLLQLHNPYQVR